MPTHLLNKKQDSPINPAIEEKQDIIADNQTNGDQKTVIQTLGEDVGVQNPLQIDGDSVYAKDIDVSRSISTGWTGDILSPFNDLHSELTNDSTDNPKVLFIHFKRTIYSNAVGFGSTEGGDFKNLEIEFIGSGNSIRYTHDEIANDATPRTTYLAQTPPIAYNAMRLKFHTADMIEITNITTRKAIATDSMLKAVKDDGVVIDIGATDSGNLRVSNAEDGLSIASGDVQGTTFIHKFGNAPDFDALDGEVTIWDGAEDGEPYEQMQYIFSTGADIDSISAENAGDTEDITIIGLDVDYNQVEQTVTLAGQTRVALTTSLTRVIRAFNANGVDLLGHVFIYENGTLSGGVPTDSTTIRAVIHPENNQTEMAVYTVPAGKTAYVRDWYSSTAGGNKTSNYIMKLKSRLPGKVFRLKHKTAISDEGTSYIQHKYVEPEVFTEKTDIIVTTEATAVGTTAASISAGFDVVLIDN